MATNQLQTNQIINLYHSGITPVEMASKFGVHFGTIYKLLKKNGIVCNKTVKYSFDRSYFKVIDTEEKAYWLGFIYADGAVIAEKGRHNHLRIELEKKDTNHLYLFQKAIDSNHPIKEQIRDTNFKKNAESAIFYISSVKLVQDLINCGIMQDKSSILKWPDFLSKDLYRHFIRGYFDGDGSWFFTYDKYLGFNICSGSKNFLVSVQTILVQILYLYETELSQTGNTYYLSHRNLDDCKEFYKFMYDNASIWLERKRQIAELGVKNVNA